jgi:AcrR family transcriptional regulator
MDKPQSEYDATAPLPRGRHGLTPEEVASHQRERIVAAVAAALDEHGYGDLTVGRVIAAAGISRSTFYVHFANKREAVLAAHDSIFERFFAAVTAACGGRAKWPVKVSAAIGATVDFAVSRPEEAQILSIGWLIADPALAGPISGSHDRLVALLRGVRAQSPNSAGLPDCTEEFLVAGIAAIVARHLVTGNAGQLRLLQPDLVELTLLPYYGAGEAARLFGAPR